VAQEIRDERGLAEAGLGNDVEEPPAFIGLEPAKETVATERLFRQEWALDLRRTQRETGAQTRRFFGQTVAALRLDGQSQILHPHSSFPERRRVR
jgi:hypothetical protein